MANIFREIKPHFAVGSCYRNTPPNPKTSHPPAPEWPPGIVETARMQTPPLVSSPRLMCVRTLSRRRNRKVSQRSTKDKFRKQMGLKTPSKKTKQSSQRRMSAPAPKRRGLLTPSAGTRQVWLGGGAASQRCCPHRWPVCPSGATCACCFRTPVASCFTCVTSHSFSPSWCPATSAAL